MVCCGSRTRTVDDLIRTHAMSLKIGIVGLPNVGKSTLFNALTRSKQAEAANYPFCTIEPNVGIVEVPDTRLADLSRVSTSAKTIPTVIEFVDIAGLVKGASTGEGLGNKFLAHIRECDAIAQVVRVFSDKNVVHVHDSVDAQRDFEIISLELALADLDTVTKQLDRFSKEARAGKTPALEKKIALLQRLHDALTAGNAARTVELRDEEERVISRDLHLLTSKPMMIIENIDEYDTPTPVGTYAGLSVVQVCARLEAEFADMSRDEATQYLETLGKHETGLDRLITAGYTLLELVTYFTSGEQETRAWTVTRGTKAPQAAAVIHTDFEKGFIRAEVVDCPSFVELAGWSGAKNSGKMRVEGKDYVVQDGDVCYFRIAN